MKNHAHVKFKFVSDIFSCSLPTQITLKHNTYPDILLHFTTFVKTSVLKLQIRPSGLTEVGRRSLYDQARNALTKDSTGWLVMKSFKRLVMTYLKDIIGPLLLLYSVPATQAVTRQCSHHGTALRLGHIKTP